MSEHNELAICPCGKIPDELEICDAGQGSKWALVVPGCCGEWSIEFRTMYKPFTSDACMKLATEAWSEAPRGGLKLTLKAGKGFERGYFCAVACLLRESGIATTDVKSLFKQGGDWERADVDDIELFKKYRLTT